MAAKVLASKRNGLAGQVKFIFQPAEEGLGGAKLMVEGGILENPKVDAAIAVHLWTPEAVGQIRVCEGALLAASDRFTIQIFGKGGHAAIPQTTVDGIVVASQVVNALQTIVGRNINPLESAVVTIGTIQGGTAANVIASEVRMTGTIRTFSEEVREKVIKRMDELIAGITRSMGGAYSFEINPGSVPATVNDSEMTNLVIKATSAIVGMGNVREFKLMGSEDMSLIMREVPGCYFFVGCGDKERQLSAPHHTDWFDFDEDAMLIGVQSFVSAVEMYLTK